jgi:multidrug efflux pump subunit AcrA (membrane-fusion protein)
LKIYRIFVSTALLLISFNSGAFEVNGILDWSELSVKSFSVQGFVEKVAVHSGELVKKDQLLAQLDRRSLLTIVEKNKAGVQQFDPLIFDARIEFNNAEELFERTVLSEVDLQKVQGVLKALEAQQAIARADLKLAKIQYNEAQLLAPYDARLVRVDLLPGLVISEENMSSSQIILAQLGSMRAIISLSVEQAAQITLGQKVKLNINGDQFQGVVISSVQQSSVAEQYTLSIKFKHDISHTYLAGQKVSVVF